MKTRSAIAGATCILLAGAPAFAQHHGQHGQSQPPQPAQERAGQPQPQQEQAGRGTGEGVVVTGQRSAVQTSIDRLSFDIGNDLQTQTGSIADALRNIPGVEVDAQGNISLRGDSNVRIMIDGRPSGQFEGEGRGDALQNFPADQIARVEVITNPNAAMSPEGTAGVINLVTRRDRRAVGPSGSIRASIGEEGRWNASLAGSGAIGKVRLNGDIGYRAIRSDNEELRERTVLDRGSGAFLDQRGDADVNVTGEGFRNARLGFEYDATPRDRLSGDISSRGFAIDSDVVELFTAEAVGGGLARDYTRFLDTSFSRDHDELRAGWRRTLGEVGQSASTDHEIVADVKWEKNKFERDLDTRFVNRIPTAGVNVERLLTDASTDDVEGRLEFASPMPGEAKLRLGGELNWRASEFTNFGARGPSFDALTVNPAFTNRFDYEENVYALFATYERPFGDFTVQGGLRLEQTEIAIDQLTTQVQAENEYFRAYPTLFVTYDVNDNNTLRASYSRRIQRPDAQQLNPFSVYVDPQNLRQGNPNLEPEITDNYEVGYQFRQGPTFVLATLFYAQSQDGVTEVVRELPDGILLTTQENLSERRRFGLELALNGRLTNTLTYNLSGLTTWNEIDVRTTAFTGTRDGTSTGGRFSLNWTPTDKDFFQLTGFVSGDQLLAQGTREMGSSLNVGYRRKVTDRLSLVFTGQNVLDSMRQVVTVETPDLRERTERKFMPRAYFVGFSYALGETAGSRRQRPEFEFDQGAPVG